MSDARDIVHFWFQDITDQTPLRASHPPCSLWFSQNSEFDQRIKERFEVDLEKARQGQYQSWEDSAQGRLALILLFDQFSRNMYRGLPKAFATDPLALDLSRRSVADGFDRSLALIQRMFVYLPFMHAEDLHWQNEAVRLFEGLREECQERFPSNAGYFQSQLHYACGHRDLIERFGRFPHRNSILKRPSTSKELKFLKASV